MKSSSVAIKLVLLAALAVVVTAATLINTRRPPRGADAPASEQSADIQNQADGSSSPKAAVSDVKAAWQDLLNSAKRRVQSTEDRTGTIREIMNEFEAFAKSHAGTEQSAAAWLNLGDLAAVQGDYEAAEKNLRKALQQAKDPGRLAAINARIAELSIRPGGTPPAFSAKSLAGREISLAGYKGMVLLLDFWATWCPPCIAELPNVKRVYDTYHGKGFEIVSISLDRTEKALRNFVEKQGLNWTHIYNASLPPAKDVATQYGVKTIPQMILIGRNGKIVDVGLRGAALEAAVKRAINAKEGASTAGRETRPAYAALGQTAPELAVQEWVRGEPTSLDDLKGKVVLLDIFQIICPGCHRAHPEIVRMRKRYAERGFEVLGLAVAFELRSVQTPAHIRDYVKREKYPYPVAIDQGLIDTFRRYRSRGTPFSVLIDRRGRIRYLDFFRLGRVESLVQRLLDEEA